MIGVFGGTFDPIHNGHLRLALFVKDALGLQRIHLVPCGVPVHRETPAATAMQRLRMLQLALFPFPYLLADAREIQRPGPSYMVDTLDSIRQDLAAVPQLPICLIIGADSYEHLETWSRWQSLLDAAHIVVLQRPGWDTGAVSSTVTAFCRDRVVDSAAALRGERAGKIFFLANPLLPTAASTIRALIAEGHSAASYVPLWVWDYIQKNGLYQSGLNQNRCHHRDGPKPFHDPKEK